MARLPCEHSKRVGITLLCLAGLLSRLVSWRGPGWARLDLLQKSPHVVVAASELDRPGMNMKSQPLLAGSNTL